MQLCGVLAVCHARWKGGVQFSSYKQKSILKTDNIEKLCVFAGIWRYV